MTKLKVAVVLIDDFDPKTGGGFSYYERLISKIDAYEFDERFDICYISNNHISSESLSKKHIIVPKNDYLNQSTTFIYRILISIFSFSFLKYLKIDIKITNIINRKVNLNVLAFYKSNKIDLLYYPTPNFYPDNYPFIATHWDLAHKTMFPFPEIIQSNKFEKREYYHRKTLSKAFAIFTESEQSKKELVTIEKIYEDKIFVVPLFPGKVVEINVNESIQSEILKKWDVTKNEFYFYPAQFWAHKNHYGLIKAFQIVIETYPNFKLILTGSDKGNLDYIKQVVREFNLEDKIIFTGFVSDEAVYTFYKNAIALVMPTFLGPTNMPLLEAHQLGCAVICSDLEGHKQQMKNKAIYFNPRDEKDIALKMIEVLSLERQDFTFESYDNTASILNDCIKAIYNVRKTFGYEF